MKKLLTALTLSVLFSFSIVNTGYAQDEAVEDTTQMEEMMEDTAAAKEMAEEPVEEAGGETAEEEVSAEVETEQTFHQRIKDTFIDGGPFFMSFVLVCLILGLALCIERIIYLNMASTNKTKLLNSIEDALASGGVEAAKDVCRNTRGPIASIFYQGLERYDEGIEMVEKSVVSYGGVQMGLLEKGLSWISLFIALAPMLGFMGTVIGMIEAFEAIAAENNISPGVVANGIKVALITTVSGLIVAIILQIFYNYIVAKVDGIVNDMEDASISLVDMLLRHRSKA
ncbi:MAG: MotA/TolQ/ExbB proton channel family protein [Flavobacteriales bacterium]|nr:MotA/TolQ/ExbB proton channel family protein [Flavobacteriales bacterium]